MKAVRENAGVPRFEGQQIGLVLGCGYCTKTVEADRIYRSVQIDTTCEFLRVRRFVSLWHDQFSYSFKLKCARHAPKMYLRLVFIETEKMVTPRAVFVVVGRLNTFLVRYEDCFDCHRD